MVLYQLIHIAAGVIPVPALEPVQQLEPALVFPDRHLFSVALIETHQGRFFPVQVIRFPCPGPGRQCKTQAETG